MRKAIVSGFVSLDGFIAGPYDAMDWVFKSGGSDEVVDQVMKTTGSVMLGKRTFEVSVKQNQLPYEGAVKVPQFVVTYEARDMVTIGGLTFTFVTNGVEHAVELAKTAAGAALFENRYDCRRSVLDSASADFD